MSLANFSGILVVVGDCGQQRHVSEKVNNCPIPGYKSTDKAVEEEVVVVRHGSIVEHRGHLRALGVLDQQLSRLGVRIDGVYTTISITITAGVSPISSMVGEKGIEQLKRVSDLVSRG